MDFYSILEFEQLKAIQAAIEPSMESIYRMRCRSYSQKFFTPLHEVYDLDPSLVLQSLYEDQYHPSIVEEELEELIEKLYIMRDPNYASMSKQEIEDLVDSVLNKEIARAAKKKRPTQETIQTEIKAAEIKKPEIDVKPKSGSMSFGDLEKIDSKVEGKNGFED
jgi:hypothetical protein